tara:strand:+ start:439 stop:582 length:144 start_codon:yes stop_codon:yes gene_type:complete
VDALVLVSVKIAQNAQLVAIIKIINQTYNFSFFLSFLNRFACGELDA